MRNVSIQCPWRPPTHTLHRFRFLIHLLSPCLVPAHETKGYSSTCFYGSREFYLIILYIGSPFNIKLLITKKQKVILCSRALLLLHIIWSDNSHTQLHIFRPRLTLHTLYLLDEQFFQACRIKNWTVLSFRQYIFVQWPHKRRHLCIYAANDSELWAEVRRGQRSGSLDSSLIAASQRWPPIRSGPFYFLTKKH